MPFTVATNGGLVPVLSTNSIFPKLQGTYPPSIPPYTNIIIDVYQLDQEGWADGVAFAGFDFRSYSTAELTDGTTFTNGFA